MTSNLNQEKLSQLTEYVEDHYINLVKIYNNFQQLDSWAKGCWAQENLKCGELYTYNKLYLALSGRTDGGLYPYNLNRTCQRIDPDTILLYLGIKKSTRIHIDVLTFLYNNEKWTINVIEAIFFKPWNNNE